MGLSKSQAALLASNFLDDLGSSKDDLQPRETATELVLIAADLIQAAQDNLIRGKHIATGKLSESIVAHEPEWQGNSIQVEIFADFYWKFLDKGVKGTKKGQSNAGYSFKYDGVSPKMLKAMQLYLKQATNKIKNVKKYTAHGHEVKIKSVAEVELSNAYALGRSIKMNGIRPSGFMSHAIESSTRDVEQRLGAALVVDVIDSINRNIR